MRCLPFLLLPVFLLVGCSLIPDPLPRAAEYELRLPSSVQTGQTFEALEGAAASDVAAFGGGAAAFSGGELSELEVPAPSWLQSRAIYYRLDYREEARRRAYTQSRWLAHPSEMITLALVRYFSVSDQRAAARHLRLHLDEMIHIFTTEQDSHTLLQVRAELVEPGRPVSARRNFTIRRPAPTPDAAGAVAAHNQALAQLAQDLHVWLRGRM